eukprot:jgi/Mesvir1/13584/Mv02812-RA.1
MADGMKANNELFAESQLHEDIILMDVAERGGLLSNAYKTLDVWNYIYTSLQGTGRNVPYFMLVPDNLFVRMDRIMATLAQRWQGRRPSERDLFIATDVANSTEGMEPSTEPSASSDRYRFARQPLSRNGRHRRGLLDWARQPTGEDGVKRGHSQHNGSHEEKGEGGAWSEGEKSACGRTGQVVDDWYYSGLVRWYAPERPEHAPAPGAMDDFCQGGPKDEEEVDYWPPVPYVDGDLGVILSWEMVQLLVDSARKLAEITPPPPPSVWGRSTGNERMLACLESHRNRGTGSSSKPAATATKQAGNQTQAQAYPQTKAAAQEEASESPWSPYLLTRFADANVALLLSRATRGLLPESAGEAEDFPGFGVSDLSSVSEGPSLGESSSRMDPLGGESSNATGAGIAHGADAPVAGGGSDALVAGGELMPPLSQPSVPASHASLANQESMVDTRARSEVEKGGKEQRDGSTNGHGSAADKSLPNGPNDHAANDDDYSSPERWQGEALDPHLAKQVASWRCVTSAVTIIVQNTTYLPALHEYIAAYDGSAPEEYRWPCEVPGSLPLKASAGYSRMNASERVATKRAARAELAGPQGGGATQSSSKLTAKGLFRGMEAAAEVVMVEMMMVVMVVVVVMMTRQHGPIATTRARGPSRGKEMRSRWVMNCCPCMRG